MRVSHRWRAVREIGEFVEIAMFEGLVRPGIELRGPGWRGCVEAKIAKEGQPMRQESAANDEHALVAQRPERRPIWKSSLGSRLGIETCNTGTSASGYITVSGT